MSSLYFMPTKLVHGAGCLDQLPGFVGELGMVRPLLVTDKIIAETAAYAKATQLLDGAGVSYQVFDGCEVDARLHHVGQQTRRILDDNLDGVICIGGGSVMCAGKAMAICAANGGKSFVNFVGLGNFTNKALPMIMVPTTAGSGSEVSQVTLVKDEDTHRKYVGGGPLSFPDIAILDPVMLESCPQSVSAVALVDALTHCMDSYFNTTTTPLTEALAFEGARLLIASARGSVIAKDRHAMADNLLGAAMANMACGNAKLGLAHCLSLPMESGLDLTHGIGVGVLMPRVLKFNAPVAPEKVFRIADAWGVKAGGRDLAAVVGEIEAAFYRLFDNIGFPKYYDPRIVDPALIPELAMEAGRGLYGEGYLETPPTQGTLIASPNLRRATIREGEELLEQCFA